MQETGTVVQVSDGRAGVQVRREAGPQCRGCTACRALGDLGLVLWIEARDLRVGDEVTIEVPEVNPWRAILMVFGLPLAAAMTGLIVGSRWTWLQHALGLAPDTAGLALGGFLGASAFVAAWLEERRLGRRHPPRVLQVRHAP